MYIVFDIGGTKLRVATSDDGLNIAEPQIFSTPKSFEEGINLLQKTIKSFADNSQITAIAGGIAGRLDEEKTQLLGAPHLPSWVNQPLKENLQKAFNVPVFLENDAAMAGLGEALKGAGKGYERVTYLTISTGVGGAQIINGQIDRSSSFNPGHQVIEEGGDLCACGERGHLEAYISGSAIEKIYGKRGEEITDPKFCVDITKWLSVGLKKIIVDWPPDIIVLGGSVTQSIPLDKLQIAQPPIVKSALGDVAGLIGALEYLKQL